MNALELADALDSFHNPNDKQAATMLRQQHSKIERLARQKLADKDAYEALRAENQRHKTNSDLQMQRAIKAEAELSECRMQRITDFGEYQTATEELAAIKSQPVVAWLCCVPGQDAILLMDEPPDSRYPPGYKTPLIVAPKGDV